MKTATRSDFLKALVAGQRGSCCRPLQVLLQGNFFHALRRLIIRCFWPRQLQHPFAEKGRPAVALGSRLTPFRATRWPIQSAMTLKLIPHGIALETKKCRRELHPVFALFDHAIELSALFSNFRKIFENSAGKIPDKNIGVLVTLDHSVFTIVLGGTKPPFTPIGCGGR